MLNEEDNSQFRINSKEISKMFGIMSILFGYFLPPTGFAMGIIGFFYESKSAREHNEKYSLFNLVLNSMGMIISGLRISYIIIFKLNFLF